MTNIKVDMDCQVKEIQVHGERRSLLDDTLK